jgi:hypothetical protein
MEYKFKKANGSSVEVEISGEEVVFERMDMAKEHEYSASYFMDGYVGDEKKYEAVGEFSFGSDDFVELEEIEKI